MAITTETVIASFSYESITTKKNYENILRKATTVAKNSGVKTTLSTTVRAHEIQVIFTFENVGYNFVDQMRSSLNRFIDSHKEAATYGWSYESVLVGA